MGDTSLYHQLFRLKALHLLALFAFIYVGAEVTVGGLSSLFVFEENAQAYLTGWIVSYAMKERGGGTSSGYLSTGFWGGLTLGRVALLWPTKKVSIALETIYIPS